jgi:hypothetical protein
MERKTEDMKERERKRIRERKNYVRKNGEQSMKDRE